MRIKSFKYIFYKCTSRLQFLGLKIAICENSKSVVKIILEAASYVLNLDRMFILLTLFVPVGASIFAVVHDNLKRIRVKIWNYFYGLSFYIVVLYCYVYNSHWFRK